MEYKFSEFYKMFTEMYDKGRVINIHSAVAKLNLALLAAFSSSPLRSTRTRDGVNTRLHHDLAKLEQENFNQKPRRLLTESQFKVRVASRKLSNTIVGRRGSKILSTWGRSVWEQRASGRSKEELDRREWCCNVFGR